MHEVKFRAWHTKLKRMFSAEEMGADQLTLMPDGRGFVNVSSVDVRLSQFAGKTMIPMQYTNLKDRNGKEIYQDDIVKIPAKYFRVLRLRPDQKEDMIGRVWQDDEMAAFNIGDIRWNVIPRKDLAKRYYEVIGNIYENSSLIHP